MVKSIVPRAKEVNYGKEKKLSISRARQWCRFAWSCLISPRASLPLPMRGLSPKLLSFAWFKVVFFFDKRKEGMGRAYLSSITDSMVKCYYQAALRKWWLLPTLCLTYVCRHMGNSILENRLPFIKFYSMKYLILYIYEFTVLWIAVQTNLTSDGVPCSLTAHFASMMNGRKFRCPFSSAACRN